MALRSLKAVLVDLSGTLHIEDAAVPGAQEALTRSVSGFGENIGRFCSLYTDTIYLFIYFKLHSQLKYIKAAF